MSHNRIRMLVEGAIMVAAAQSNGDILRAGVRQYVCVPH